MSFLFGDVTKVFLLLLHVFESFGHLLLAFLHGDLDKGIFMRRELDGLGRSFLGLFLGSFIMEWIVVVRS